MSNNRVDIGKIVTDIIEQLTIAEVGCIVDVPVNTKTPAQNVLSKLEKNNIPAVVYHQGYDGVGGPYVLQLQKIGNIVQNSVNSFHLNNDSGIEYSGANSNA